MNNNLCNIKATATVRGGKESPCIYGKVNFYQKSNHVLVEACINGLPETASGFFGFHIHEGTDCNGKDFANTANHYNPENSPHPSHSGDLPPLILCNGGTCLTVATDRFKVQDIIGRTVVIHNLPDDFNSQPSGNSGNKIACGVICRV